MTTKQEINSSPVSLPVGSYDYEALKKGTDAAAKGDADAYDANVDKALKSANKSEIPEVDPRDIPGYRFTDVENKDLGVTETIQVFDPKLAETQEQEAAAITPHSETETAAPRG
jgi:hypothetical protein